MKLARGIQPEDDDGVQQVKLYDEGIGSSGGLFDRLIGGITGKGIDENIQQLYKFLAINYVEGDELYLFGFSRGAYTVRSLVGLIHTAGLVRRESIDQATAAYELYRSNKAADSTEAQTFREKHGERVPITLLCCFDTVGALGIPMTMDLLRISRKRYSFHDTKVSSSVSNALHVLSIDEERVAFQPTLMEADSEVPNQVTQLYFWGTHGGVGGGNSNETIPSALTLKFVLQEMETRGLSLKVDLDIESMELDAEAEIPSATDSYLDMLIRYFTGVSKRLIPSTDAMHADAIQRYQNVCSWRPISLKPLHQLILDRLQE